MCLVLLFTYACGGDATPDNLVGPILHEPQYGESYHARVFLGESSTLSACAGRFLLAGSVWCDERIEATLEERPPGFDWA